MMNSVEKTLYVVDDDEHTRILIKAQLESLGQVFSFESAKIAMESIDSDKLPDLVVTDIDMPEVSGLEFLDWLRERSATLPIILVSAFHSDDNLFKALEKGATDFICKPFPLRNIRASAISALKTSHPENNISVSNEGSWVSFTFDSHHEYLRRVNSLITTLVEKKTNKDICNAIKLAIEEIGTNAIEWGNQNDQNLKVTIKYRLSPNKITLCIEDEGAGFDNLGLPSIPADHNALLHQRESEGKRIGGYGINLVTQVMDEVVYNRSGNQIVMSRYFQAEEEA